MQTEDNLLEAHELFCDVCSISEQVQFPHENQDAVRVAVSVLKQLGWTCHRCRQSVKKWMASDLCASVASLSTKLSDALNDIAEIKTNLKQNKSSHFEKKTHVATNSTESTLSQFILSSQINKDGIGM